MLSDVLHSVVPFSKLSLYMVPVIALCLLLSAAHLRGLPSTTPSKGLTVANPLRSLPTTTPSRGLTAANHIRSLPTTTPLRGLTAAYPLRSLPTTTPLRGLTAANPLKEVSQGDIVNYYNFVVCSILNFRILLLFLTDFFTLFLCRELNRVDAASNYFNNLL